jgi:hypothetical protein
MIYRILSERGHGYSSEVGTEGERQDYLRALENRLQANLTLAKTFAATSGAVPHPVASNLPGVGAGRVRELVKFHQQQQDNTTKGDLLNAEVIRVRQWIFRQSASLTPEGKIIWPKSHRVVEYDTQLAQRELTRVEFRGGMLYMTNGKPLDTTQMVTAFSGPGYAIYVMSMEGHIHVSSHAVGYRHHSSMLAGGYVAGAGELQVKAGRLVWLSNKSGHYQPDVFLLIEVLHQLQVSAVPMTFQIQLHPAMKTYPSVHAFMVDNGFDNDTFECDQILMTYEEYLTPAFFRSNQLAFLKPGGGGRPGIYDLSVVPPRRVPLSEFESNMVYSGMKPDFRVAPGTDR